MLKAFANAFDTAYVISYVLQLLTGSCAPITMLPDSSPLFDILSKSSATPEILLLVDLEKV